MSALGLVIPTGSMLCESRAFGVRVLGGKPSLPHTGVMHGPMTADGRLCGHDITQRWASYPSALAA
jgi:hypothetical protein